MDRRNLLTGAALTAATASLATPAISQNRQKLVVASVWSDAQTGPGRAATRLSERMSALTDGQLSLEIVAPAETPLATYQAVADGSFDMCFGAEEMWRNLNTTYPLFTSVPGGMNSNEFESWIIWGGGLDLWRDLAADAGVIPFLAGDLGPHAAIASRNIASISDVSSTRVAATGLAVDVWQALGAETVIDVTDRGAVPEADLFDGSIVRDAALLDRATHRLSSATVTPNYALSANVNASAHAALSAEHQMMLETALQGEHMDQRAEAVLASYAADDALGKIEVATPVPELTAEIFAVSRAVLDDLSADSTLAGDAVWSFQLHQEDAAGWTAIGEGAYTIARHRTHQAGGQ